MTALDPSLKRLSDRYVEQVLTGDPDDKAQESKPVEKDGPK